MDEYPNSSEAIDESQQWSPEKPEERKEVERQEQTKVSTSIGVIQDVLAWFDKRADLYGSLDALDINNATDPNVALNAMTTAKNMREEFRAKSTEFRAAFAKYLEQEEVPKPE